MNARTADEGAEKAAQDLVEALAEASLHAEPALTGGGRIDPKRPDIVVTRPDGSLLVIEVKARAAPSAADVAAFGAPAPGALPVLVADRVSETAAAALRARGWGYLDRRGHIHLEDHERGLFVDRAVTSIGGRQSRHAAGSVLTTRRGQIVAAELLLDPDRPLDAANLQDRTGLARSVVYDTLARLRDEHLVTTDREPLLPELFWELATYWSPQWVYLADVPRPGLGDVELERLQIGFDADTGWALAGDVAAAALGAPVVVAGTTPKAWYVPDTRIVHAAVNLFGLAAEPNLQAGSVAAAPTPAAVTNRLNGTAVPGTEWLCTRPLFIALDLAQDAARGREILDRWDPQEASRVW